MNNKNLLIICITAIIITAIVAGTAFMIMNKQVKSQEQKIVQNNNTTKIANNTTVEKISNENNQQNTNNEKELQQKDSQVIQDLKNNPNMPDDMKQIYIARQRAAEDGVPMYEYTQSPELVQKYQAMD